jgi:hypothetical protein
MSEQDVRDGLAGALADEPPLSFDPDRLVARAQREIRRRRSLVGVGGATAVIAVAAVVAATLLHPTTPGQAAAAAPHLTTAPSTTAAPPSDFTWPPAGMHTKVYSATEERALAAGWTQHLTQTFGTVVPGVSGVAIQPWGGEASGSISTGQNYLDTFVKFTIHGTQTAMAIQVAAPGQDSISPAKSCGQSTSPDKCVFTRTTDGGLLVYSDIVEGGGDLHLRTVTDYRQDGTVVYAAGYNYDPTASARQLGTTAIPVTDAQLTKFATDPVLAF